MYNGIGYQNYTGKDRIREMYRQFTNLDEDYEITKENLNEYQVKKVASYANKSPEKVKADILNENYTGEF